MVSGSNTALGVRLTAGATSWIAISDERSKLETRQLSNVLEAIADWRTVEFRYKRDHLKNKHLGLYAQDVERDFPQVVKADGNGELGVAYTELVPVLVRGIQELKTINESLKRRISILERCRKNPELEECA